MRTLGMMMAEAINKEKIRNLYESVLGFKIPSEASNNNYVDIAETIEDIEADGKLADFFKKHLNSTIVVEFSVNGTQSNKAIFHAIETQIQDVINSKLAKVDKLKVKGIGEYLAVPIKTTSRLKCIYLKGNNTSRIYLPQMLRLYENSISFNEARQPTGDYWILNKSGMEKKSMLKLAQMAGVKYKGQWWLISYRRCSKEEALKGFEDVKNDPNFALVTTKDIENLNGN